MRNKQLLAKELKEFLSHIPEDTPISIRYGEETIPAEFLDKYGKDLVICPEVYGENQEIYNIKTILKFK